MGVDSVHAPSWSHLTGLWGLAPPTATAPPPDISTERWRVDFIPEAQGMRPPVVRVERPQLNHVTMPLELMPRATVSPVGWKVMGPLIKLPQFDGTGSLDTFLTKFQHLAAYLRWDDEDTFHHLCASLEGVVGQVLWDIGPRAMTADIICLLQTRFGTQLQAEHLKAELRATRRAPWESLWQLYQDIW